MAKKKSKGLFASFRVWLKKRTNTERIIWACLIHGFFWVDCSYLLAWLQRNEIAQDLSKVAITEIIGVVLIYAIKEGAANLSKNNIWPDKPKTEIKTEEGGRTI